MKKKFNIMLLFGLAISLPSYGQLLQSQIIRASNNIQDELGNVLKGTDPSSHVIGIEPEIGALVQILRTTDDVIYPPSINGEPHPNNIVIWETNIGLGVGLNKANQGLFSAAVSPRPQGNSKIFVRVFNRATIQKSSFYEDSDIYTINMTEPKPINVNISKLTKPLDIQDTDQDGIHNSWEKSLGSSQDLVDSDFDGYSDWDEYVLGTNPTNENSFLRITEITINDPQVSISWSSVASRVYYIESFDLLDQTNVVQRLTVYGNGQKATGTLTETALNKSYRIKGESLIRLPFEI